MLRTGDIAQRPDIQVGELFVSPSRRHIEGPGGSLQLEPRILQVLLLLLDARGKVVTRGEMFEQCWGGAMVGDDSLNRAVGKIRKAADKIVPEFLEIETIPRTGYRLTGPVVEALRERDNGPDDRATGFTAQPGRLSRRLVIGGGAVLAAGAGLWILKPGRSDPATEDLVAEAEQILRQEYSRGKLGALPLLEKAIAARPGDSRALGLLAYARTVAVLDGQPGARQMRAAGSAIRDALQADPDDAHALLALSLLETGAFEWARTERRLRQILGLDPDNTIALSWLVALLQAAGLKKESWIANERAIAIDRLAPNHQWRKALKLWIFGRVSEADTVLDRLIGQFPDHPWVWNARFLIFAFTGRPHAALDMIDDSTNRPDSITPQRMAQWRPTLAALESGSRENIARARDANLQAARQSPGQAAYAVMALGGIGEIDAAFDVANGFLLSRGPIVTRRPSDTSNALVNNPDWRRTQWLFTPPLEKFRKDPRFAALCDGIGLTQYWAQRGLTAATVA